MPKPITEQDVLHSQIKAQDHQSDNDPNEMFVQDQREEKITNILAQISPDSLLEDIEHRIRGEKKNSLTHQWESISQDKDNIFKVSELMVVNFMTFLGAILNQNTTMSNFSSAEINNIMTMVLSYVSTDLDVNYEKYGLTTVDEITGEVQANYTEMSRIGHIIQLAIFTVLKRAMNGAESRRVFGSLRVNESLNANPAKKTLKDAMSFWN